MTDGKHAPWQVMLDYAFDSGSGRLPPDVDGGVSAAQAFDEIFDDVDRLSDLEGLSLHCILRVREVSRVLDCTCGTGIQALGLANRGYDVYCSDISENMLAVAARKLANIPRVKQFEQSDVRDLRVWEDGAFDAVISAGTSLAQLGSMDELNQALESMRRVVRPDGTVVVGSRDYTVARNRNEVVLPRGMRVGSHSPTGAGEYAEWAFDVRLFQPDHVSYAHVFLRAGDGEWSVRCYTGSALYLKAQDVMQAMTGVGLREVSVFDIKGDGEYTGGEWYFVVSIR